MRIVLLYMRQRHVQAIRFDLALKCRFLLVCTYSQFWYKWGMYMRSCTPLLPIARFITVWNFISLPLYSSIIWIYYLTVFLFHYKVKIKRENPTKNCIYSIFQWITYITFSFIYSELIYNYAWRINFS